MENASKALLIAGSVLIVILLIAFGMKIFNSTSGSADEIEGTMQTAEMAMFNNKFLPYVGTNKPKAQAMSLMNQIIVNNSSANNIHKVGVSLMSGGTLDGAIKEVTDLTKTINGQLNPDNFANKSSFTIEADFDANGYVNLIRMY